MRFRVNSTLTYQVTGPSTLIFSIHALRTVSQQVVKESLDITPGVKTDEFVSGSGESRFMRLVAPEKIDLLTVHYEATVVTHCTVIDAKDLERVPVQYLDHELISYLFPSRYCQSDKLARMAWTKFGSIGNAYERVVAITDWIYENVEYVSGTTDSTTSAYDIVTLGAGVCRDFAHLGIAFCRALNIPARYFTGYAYQLVPQDFHACFEAFIGDRWILFDATRLVPLNGMVRIASGRDAADAAVATIFGQAQWLSAEVSCETETKDFQPLTRAELGKRGVCLEVRP